MTQNEFNLTIAESLFNSDDSFPVDLEKAWPWIGYAKKQNAKDKLTRNFELNYDYTVTQMRETNVDGTFSHSYELIELSVDCFKSMAMMAGTTKGKEIRKYFLECERKLKAIQNQTKSISKSKEFNELINGIFENVNIDSSLIAGLKLNTAQRLCPELKEELEASRSLLINSTASEHKTITVTELGKLLNPQMSAVKLNQHLIKKGLQIKNPNKKGQKDLTYTATTLGKEHSKVVLATGTNNDTTYQMLRWSDSVIDLL